MTRTLIAAALCALSGAGASAPLSMSPPRSAPAPGFTARVTPAGARFVFPLAKRPTWEWNLPTTQDNRAEYMWAVQLDNGGRAYEFGFYRFKFAGARPARGSLGDLLFTGQQTVQLLLSDRPQRAVFRIEASGGKGVTREVQVEYDP